MSNSTQQSFVSVLIFGSIFIIVGAYIFLMSIDVFHVSEENFNAPRWVVAVVGITFALAGAITTLNGLKGGFGDHNLFILVYNVMLLMFMVLFAVPFHWLAFGSDELTMNSSISVIAISLTQNNGIGANGRLIFCLGAILMDLFIVYILYRIIKGKNISKGE